MTPRLSLAIAGTLLCSAALAQGETGVRGIASADTPLQLQRSSAMYDELAPSGAAPAEAPPARRIDAALLQTPADEAAQSQSRGLPLIEIEPPTEAAAPIDLTSETDDLFQRIRNGFSMPDINDDLVLYHQQWYLNRPDYLRRMLERCSLYMHFIVEELDKRDMPMELALLPMIESAYNPMAYSRAKASGLWQFIPATGKRFKLDQDWWMDERRDIVASTSAALDYLESLYEMHGDWHLALASYNWGEGAVGRAIAKNRAQGLPEDYMSLSMPRETRNYVPKLQALKNILSNPNVFAQLGLPRIANRPYFGTITKTANIDVKVAARLAGMPVQEFVALNPAHNRPVIKSDTPMVIPADKVDTFISNLEAHEENNKPLSSWRAYTVRPGDKLESVAPKFGMTVANLKAVNGITGRIRIRPGLTLLVSGNGNDQPLDTAEFPAQPLIAEPEPPASRTVVQRHLVRKTDTLASIAKQYGVSMVELKRMNRLRSEMLKPGMKLTVAVPTKPVAEAKGDKANAKLAKNEVNGAKANAKQAKADAKMTKADAKTAKTETRQAKADVKTAKADAKTAKPDARTAHAKPDKKASRTAQYTVRNGDTLASIARQFKVGTDDLMRWNKISAKTLKPGNTLVIQLAQNP